MIIRGESTFKNFIAPFLSSISTTDNMNYHLLMASMCQASCIHTYVLFSGLEKKISPKSPSWYVERLRFQQTHALNCFTQLLPSSYLLGWRPSPKSKGILEWKEEKQSRALEVLQKWSIHIWASFHDQRISSPLPLVLQFIHFLLHSFIQQMLTEHSLCSRHRLFVNEENRPKTPLCFLIEFTF